MDWTLINTIILSILTIIVFLLVFVNYKKIINIIMQLSTNNKTKSVSWSDNIDKTTSIPTNIPTSIPTSIPTNNNLESKTLNYLNKHKESYGSKIYSVNPIKAWIAEDPENLLDINAFTAHQIINQNDANTRVQEYRDDPTAYEGSTVGEVYDNMVDNFRVKWSKFDGLEAHDPTSYYGLDVEPSANGYTGFATY